MPKEAKTAQTQWASGFKREIPKKVVRGNNSIISKYC